MCLLEALTRSKIPAGKIIAFDASPLLWRGRAYQHDAEVLRLNSTPDDMSVSSSDSGHFERWLAVRDVLGKGSSDDSVDQFSGARFVPRTVYGEYLESAAHHYLMLLIAQGWQIDLVRECVISAAPLSTGGALLRTQRGRRFRANHVVLCVGRGTPHDDYGLTDSPRFVADLYPVSRNLDMISSQDEVGIIGSGLTAVDAVLALRQRGHQAPIHLLSRQGVLPSVRQRPIRYQLRHFTPERFRQAADQGTVTLETVVRLLGEELAHAGEDMATVASEVASLSGQDPVTRLRRQLGDVNSPSRALRILQHAVPDTGPHVWPLLSDAQKLELLRRHHRSILALCCPMPPSSAAKLLSMIESGQLRIVSNIQQITATGSAGFTVTTSSGTLHPSVLINAVNTPANKIPALAAPLVDSLVTAGVAAHNPAGGLHVEPTTSRLSVEGRPSPGFYALGDLAFGTFFFTFGIPAIIKRAQEIVTALTGEMTASQDPRRPAAPSQSTAPTAAAAFTSRT